MSKDKWEPTRSTVNYAVKNIFSILGLVFAFIFSPAGLVLSIVGLNKAKAENGDTKFAKIGLIISIVVMVIELIVVISVLAVGCSAANDANQIVNDTINSFPKN